MIKIPIKKTHLHTEMKKMNQNVNTHKEVDDKTLTMGDTVVSMVADDPRSTKKTSSKVQEAENETPLQRMLKRKEEQRRIEEEKLKNAAKEAHMTKSQNKERKTKELQSNANITGTYDKNSRPNSSKQNQTQDNNQTNTTNGNSTSMQKKSSQEQILQLPNPQQNLEQSMPTYNSISFQTQMHYNPSFVQDPSLVIYSPQGHQGMGNSDIYHSRAMQQSGMQAAMQSGLYNQSQLSQMSAFNMTKNKDLKVKK